MNEQTQPQTKEEEPEAEPIQRDITIRCFRSAHVNEVEITRNGKKRAYNRVQEPRINALARLIKEHRIDVEWDFLYFLEIEFQFDKE